MPAFVYVLQDANVATKGTPFMGEEVEVPPYSLQHTYRLRKNALRDVFSTIEN